MKSIAIFASGTGSNAQNIITYFKNNPAIYVNCVFSNKENAPVLQKAQQLGVPSLSFNKENFYNSELILETLKDQNPDLIVLAGFLWKFPENIIDHFSGKIINIHPALLPKYGGKGMYGINVHKAVVENKETHSGITVHQVTKNYDEGASIFQAKIEVAATDTPLDVAQKIHSLEAAHFPKVIEKLLLKSL